MPTDGVEVNTIAFEGAMQRLRKGVREGIINPEYGTLTVQARLLAERCQTFTPPRNVGQGNAAVIRDLSRIYFPLSDRTFNSRALKNVVREDRREAWNAAARHFDGSHGLRNTIAVGFSESLHSQNRDKRGRARPGKYGNIGFVTLGPEGRAARDYMKKVKQRVGWARGGWNLGIISFGGIVDVEWVKRHSVNRGRVIDGRGDADPYVSITNDTGWAKYGRGEGERIVRNAVSTRIRDMYSYYEKMMKVAAAAAEKAA